MPQTLEHLEILQYLGLSRGVIALTKTDLVDVDWLELVRGEVAAAVAGTFLEGAAIIPVSAVTRVGLPELVNAIERELARPSGRDAALPTRLPIDRVFTLAGFGTVATGTLVAGAIGREVLLELLPAGHAVRVRGLEVHGEQVARAVAGQRVAVNVAGVDRDQVRRGDTLAAPGAYRSSTYFGARLTLTPPRRGGAGRQLVDGAPVHFHTGTSEVVARVLLSSAKELLPGGADLVGIRTEEPVVVARGDRFIIRSYSPVTTIGGGIIWEPDLTAKARNRAQLGQYLLAAEAGRPVDHLRRALAAGGGKPFSAAELAKASGLSREMVAELLPARREEAGAVALGSENEFWADAGGLRQMGEALAAYLADYYRKHPYGLGADREDVRSKVFGKTEARRYAALLDHLVESGLIQGNRDRLALVSRDTATEGRARQAWAKVEAALSETGVAPLAPAELALKVGLSEADTEDVLAALVAEGKVIRLEGLPFPAPAVGRAREMVAAYFAGGNLEMTVAAFRDLIGTTRRYALPLLEYFDRNGITIRQGDTRVAGPALAKSAGK